VAVVYNPSDKDKDQQNQDQSGSTQPVSAGTTMNAGNSTAPIGASSGSSTTQSGNPTGTSSGRFTNITNYLNANKNFNQGTGLGGKIVNNVQQQNQNLNNNVQTAQQNFNTQADQNRRQYDANFVNNTINNATTAVNNTEDVNKFNQMRDASYQGPTQLQDTPKLQVQAQNINDTTSQLGTEQGRFNSLRQMFNRPTYSAGQQKLDNVFLQNDPNQVKQLNNARVLGNQAQNTVNQANTQAQAKAQLYQNEAADTKQQTQGALNKAFSDQDAALQAKVDQGNALNQRLASELKNGTISADDAKLLGLQASDTGRLYTDSVYKNDGQAYAGSPSAQAALAAWNQPFQDKFLKDVANAGGQLSMDQLNDEFSNAYKTLQNVPGVRDIENYGVDTNAYLRNLDATKQNVASADDYARYQALSKLANVDPTLLTDPSQAGAFDNFKHFDTDAYNQAVATQKAAYESQANPLTNYLYNPDLYKFDLFNGSGMNSDTAAQNLAKLNALQNLYGVGKGIKIGE
jgi:hypothetical protein